MTVRPSSRLEDAAAALPEQREEEARGLLRRASVSGDPKEMQAALMAASSLKETRVDFTQFERWWQPGGPRGLGFARAMNLALPLHSASKCTRILFLSPRGPRWKHRVGLLEAGAFLASPVRPATAF